MISKAQFQREIELIIQNSIREDVGDGDHSSLACIPEDAKGKAKLLVKDSAILAGVDFARMVFEYLDNDIELDILIEDGKIKQNGQESDLDAGGAGFPEEGGGEVFIRLGEGDSVGVGGHRG